MVAVIPLQFIEISPFRSPPAHPAGGIPGSATFGVAVATWTDSHPSSDGEWRATPCDPGATVRIVPARAASGRRRLVIVARTERVLDGLPDEVVQGLRV